MKPYGHRRDGRLLALGVVAWICVATAAVPGCSRGTSAGRLAPPAEVLDAGAWADPSAEYRPWARWWWPGGAVDEAGLEADLARIAGAGFGGVEIQPFVVGLSDAAVAADPRVRSVGDPAFFALVAHAAHEASARGLGVDATFGSGWPTGGPFVEDATERQLLMSSVDVTGPRRAEIALPGAEPPDYFALTSLVAGVLGPFDANVERVATVAGRLVDASGVPAVLDAVVDLSERVAGDGLVWDVPEGAWRIFTFYENTTSHSVLGGAFPGAAHDALVTDPLDRAGVEAMIAGFGEPLVDRVAPGSLDGLFVDSFELIGELPWSKGFLDRFRAHMGYDLRMYLPLLFLDGGESKYVDIVRGLFGLPIRPRYVLDSIGARVREDYEAVRAALFISECIEPLVAWSRARGLALRLQAHGGYGDYLDVYAMADIPESEGLFAAGTYDFLKLASSAAHTGGREIAASETFVQASLFRTTLTVEEMRLLAGRALAAGINRIVHHGVPYSYETAAGAWYPFSGSDGFIVSFTNRPDDALWAALPDLNAYLGRLAYAMRQGEHRAEVAWLHAEANVEDRTTVLLGTVPAGLDVSETGAALLARGYVYDRVSRAGLTGAAVAGAGFRVGAADYRALLIEDLTVASPELLASALAIAEAGVPVIVRGDLPARAPGYADADARDARTRALAAALGALAIWAEAPGEIADALSAAGVAPALEAADGSPLAFAVEHRETASGHVLLLFNPTYDAVAQRIRIHAQGRRAERWDARGAERSLLFESPEDSREIEIELGPAEATILTVAY